MNGPLRPLDVSPRQDGPRMFWRPVTGDAIVSQRRFDWVGPARLVILAAAALIAFLALNWQTAVYRDAAHNSAAILSVNSVAESPGPVIEPLETILPPELVITPPPVPDHTPTVIAQFPRPGPSRLLHVVQPGETLDQLAERYLVSLNQLLEANPEIFDPDLIVAGDTIIIP